MTFSEYVQKIIQDFITSYGGNAKLAAQALGVNYVTFWGWVTGRRKPSIDQLSQLFEGMNIDFRDPIARFSNPVSFDILSDWIDKDYSLDIKSNDYVAVPLVDEQAVSPDYRNYDKAESCFLVNRYSKSTRFRINIVAVRLGKHSVSMKPILQPGAIVLVDYNDRSSYKPANIMLTMHPYDGCAMFRRVAIRGVHDDHQIIYYSDNILEYPPEVFSLKNDFEGELDNAIIGRAVWVQNFLAEGDI
jgi:hypothetical protein